MGSSSTTNLVAKVAARATATAWRCPPDRVSTAWDMFCTVAMPRLAIDVPASSFMPPLSSIRSTEPSGPLRRRSRPRNMLAAMSSAGATARVW